MWNIYEKAQQMSKRCNRCDADKPLCEFYSNYTQYKGKRYPTTRGECRTCYQCVRKGKLVAYRKAGSPPRPPAGTACQCCKRVAQHRLFVDHLHTKDPKGSIMLGWVCRKCNSSVLAQDLDPLA